jgi:signal transduction histidine kinase
MESIGQLAAGVAHDFNNLLTIILSANEALADRLDHQPTAQALARVSLQAAERGSDLVRRLLAFSRQPTADSRPIDAGEALAAIAPLFKCTIRDGVSVETVVPSRPLYCRADRIELESALLNLCVNAKDALPDGGAIDLEVGPVEVGPADAARLDLAEGAYAAFVVRDNGVGMSPEVLRRARDPLFTTKGEHGTGFGLSNAHDFAVRSGGALSIASVEGRGAIVTLYLPATEASDD